jgi:hypothetical protein
LTALSDVASTSVTASIEGLSHEGRGVSVMARP